MNLLTDSDSAGSDGVVVLSDSEVSVAAKEEPK